MMRCGNRNVIGRVSGVLCAVLLAGCASPPSVTPLLRVVGQALEEERSHLEADRRRQSAWIADQRDALRAGFDADLREQAALDATWVSEAVRVYVLAREALIEHEHAVRQELERRAGNLQLAKQAQARAIELIERQDALWRDVPDLRRWLGTPKGGQP